MKKSKGQGLIKRLAGCMLAMLVAFSMMPLASQVAFANERVTIGDYTYELAGGSVWIYKYNGNDTQIIVPTTLTYQGTKYDVYIGAEAFKDNTTLQKVAIPEGCDAIMGSAFKGCTSLVEIAIADSVQYISEDIFDDLENLKTYCFSGDELINGAGSEIAAINMIVDSGFAQHSDGTPISGVTVYTKPGSPVEKAVEQIDPTGDNIQVITVPDPYSKNTVKPTPDSGQKGIDGTSFGPGASEDVVNAAATKWGTESDPKGTVEGLLKAKATKVTKSSVTVQWTKQNKAVKYVIYGNACNVGSKKNKMKKLNVVKGSSAKFTKVAGKKVKKGTYYKFMVVAFNSSNRVVSSSKIVHAATKGGKYGNDKSVTVKSKVLKKAKSLKKGKTLKLKAKAVPQSKKLKVKRHRKVAYESSNPKIASVNSKGVVKAKKKGSCVIYAYAQNGVFKKIPVKVK